ncbi:MAG: DUF456 domain-containing protein [Rothia sp. (in: high G+C Gram-positive bacteria)]|nr:DUF456 domain-containing protein [Rothia sp. (in: high G+C Gram-positive bacteria)]
MTLAIIITLLAATLIALGIVGIVYPILPGSLAVLGGTLLWGLTLRGPEGWWLLGLGLPIIIAGMVAQAVLTGKTLKQRAIPNRSILWGVLGAVIGMFVIPIVGLFVGFALALLLSETLRSQGDIATSTRSTLAALKSMGLGILIELAAALTTGTIFTICAITYFATA